jgi:hypothetical protein
MLRLALIAVDSAAHRGALDGVLDLGAHRTIADDTAIGTLWSYAEADVTVLGVVVGLIAGAAAIVVGRRVVGQLRNRRRRPRYPR